MSSMTYLEGSERTPHKGVFIPTIIGGSVVQFTFFEGKDGIDGLTGELPMPGSESGLVYPGGEISSLRGGDRLYTIQTIRSGEDRFVRILRDGSFEITPEFVEVVAAYDRLYRGVYPGREKKNPVLTTKRVLKGLSYPNTILKFVYYENDLVAAGNFPLLDANGIPVVYSTRFMKKEHERGGVGTALLEQAIGTHRLEGEEADRPVLDCMFNTQRWESVRSAEKLYEKGLVEVIQPLHAPYDNQGKRVLYAVHAQVWVNSRAIREDGLSEGELEEVGPNDNAETPIQGSRGERIRDTMVLRPPRGVGMNVQAGDVVYYHLILPQKHEPAQEAAVALPRAA